MGAILHSNGDENCCPVRNPGWLIYMGYAIIGIFHSCWMLWNVTLCDHQWPRSSATYPWTRPLFCSCWSRIFSSFRGLGMNPISQPSFTNRPIHQSLLNFCAKKQKNQKEFSDSFFFFFNGSWILFLKCLSCWKREGEPLLCGGNPLRQRRWLWQGLEHLHPAHHSSSHLSSQQTPQVWSVGWKHRKWIQLFQSQIDSFHRFFWPASLATLALSSWMVASCSLSCRFCPGPWFWLGLWLWTWACTSRSSSRETSESDGLLVYESAEPYEQIAHKFIGYKLTTRYKYGKSVWQVNWCRHM